MVSYLVPIRHEQIVLVLERSVSRSKLIEGPNTSPSTVGAGLGVKGKPKPSDMCVSKRYSNYCLFLTPKINTLRSRSARNTNPGRMVSPPLLNVRVFYSVQFVVVFGPDQSANLCDCYLFFRHPFRMVTVNPPSTFLAYSPLNYCYTGVVPPTHILQGWKTHRQPIVNMQTHDSCTKYGYESMAAGRWTSPVLDDASTIILTTLHRSKKIYTSEMRVFHCTEFPHKISKDFNCF